MRDEVEWWVQAVAASAPGYLLTLWGRNGIGNGTGKTHLAKLAKRALHPRLVKFIHWPTLIAKTQRREDTAWTFQQIEQSGIVILDDVGAEYRSASGAADARLSALLEVRMRKFTIMTTNFSPEDWERIEPRISSRVCGRDGNRHVCCETMDFSRRARA